MNRQQAIEQAAKVIADKPDSTMDGRKFFCLYETEVIDKLRSALALPEDAEPVIEQVMAEYEREMCPWNNVDYLHRCADRYANVKEPSHLHCLAFALSRKLKSQPQADPERVALVERIDSLVHLLKPKGHMGTLLRDIHAYLTKGGA